MNKKEFINAMIPICQESGLMVITQPRYSEMETMHGVYLKKTKTEKFNFTPVTYLEDYFETNLDKNDLFDIVKNIKDVLSKSYPNPVYEISDIVGDFPKAKCHIKTRISNLKKVSSIAFNSDLFVIPYLDLAISFYLDFGNATVAITQNLINLWNVSLNEITDCAKENTLKGFQTENFFDYMGRIFDEQALHIEKVYFIYNNESDYGAVSLYYAKDILDPLAQKVGNLFLVPIAEGGIIATPISDINESIICMNQEFLETAPGEGLTESLYMYNVDSKTVSFFNN